MATIGQTLPSPENGWKRYDDSNGFIVYNGNWFINGAVGIWNGSQHYSNELGVSLEFCFKGTELRILGQTFPNGDNNIKITIDGQTETFSQQGSSSGVDTYQILNYEKTGLINGVHKVIIEKSSDTSKYIRFDAIDIDSNGYLIRPDYFETDYPEPLKSHGVAWFGFDETSGNTYDKLGNGYVGTVTGATRTQGWNNEGSALGATGVNQIVKFNAPVIPSNDFSIRFKIKCLPNTATGGQYFFNTFTSSSDLRGLFVNIYGDGYIGAGISTNTSATAWSDYFNTVDDGLLIADNQWHDILISRGQGIFTIYVIDRNKEYKTISTGSSSYHGSLNLLNRNDLVAQAGRFLNGQIDDLQIYNKALSPSDFTQKRLAVKTTDNKNLVLSTNTARVKEIPNTVEYMMLAQGGVIKEIDSAVDSTPIDFTKTTTEYEIVTNNRTPLGKGRLFTIPIGSHFKTAMIEDNY